MKDTIMIVAVSLSAIISFITLIKMVYEQGRTKQREYNVLDNLKSINSQLNNHITTLDKKLDEFMNQYNRCRQEMIGRVSKIEGRFNGLSEDKA